MLKRNSFSFHSPFCFTKLVRDCHHTLNHRLDQTLVSNVFHQDDQLSRIRHDDRLWKFREIHVLHHVLIELHLASSVRRTSSSDPSLLTAPPSVIL
jgi:hypothetical protein